MIQGKKVIVVLPAYNAGKTLERTVAAIPREGVDDIILVDDASRDETVRVARSLGLGEVLVHPRNSGYGANQKTCYRAALGRGADIVVMLHPDYQYDPRLIPAMAGMVASGIYGIVLASRILGSGSTGALAGGMPWWKYVANRALTAFQNLLTGAKLSEYHTGYRAYSAAALREIPFLANSDDFVFDNQLLQRWPPARSSASSSAPTLRASESSLDQLRATWCATGWACRRPSPSGARRQGSLAAPRLQRAIFVAGQSGRSSCARRGSSRA